LDGWYLQLFANRPTNYITNFVMPGHTRSEIVLCIYPNLMIWSLPVKQALVLAQIST